MKTKQTIKTTLTASMLLCARGALWAMPAARAATITVDPIAVGGVGCDIVEAINNANLPGGGDSSGGDCVAGDTGADIIDLQGPPNEFDGCAEVHCRTSLL